MVTRHHRRAARRSSRATIIVQHRATAGNSSRRQRAASRDVARADPRERKRDRPDEGDSRAAIREAAGGSFVQVGNHQLGRGMRRVVQARHQLGRRVAQFVPGFATKRNSTFVLTVMRRLVRVCHAPLHCGHPVITPRQLEAKASQTGRSVVTGSSAYADDDDREADDCMTA